MMTKVLVYGYCVVLAAGNEPDFRTTANFRRIHLSAQTEAAGEEEDRRYGNQRGDELPEEWQRRRSRRGD